MFWTRELLKQNAKQVLSTSYWRVFAVCLVAGLLSGGISASTSTRTYETQLQNGTFNGDFDHSGFLSFTLIVSLIVIVVAFAWATFVGAPISVGKNRYMMENRVGNPPFSSLFSVFTNKEQYLNIVKVMFQYNLEIFLWSLLCFIPGIYKSYQYYYIPYLLAENPYISYGRAKELSVAMTEGEKMEIFVLGLSFIGWILLGAIACGIGVLFVTPYSEATFAELYAAARAKAFSLNITGAEELADFTKY